MLVFGRDREIAAWVGFRLDVYDFGPSSAIGVVRDGHLVAGAVFHQYRHPAIEISFASTTPRWATRDAIRAILRYPFVQLNCRRVTAISPEDKVDAIRFMERLGFRREGHHPEALPTGAAISLGLLRADAERWL
jgi:RimJ/RimL family protein N-acetyltransferase